MKKFIIVLVSFLLVLSYFGCDMADEEISPTIDDSDTITNTSVEEGDKLKFSTTDINGNIVNDDIIRDAKIVMINFWEPWCGPCVGEMPSLEELYEEYNEQGLLILGVFSTEGMDDEVRQILDECGTSYPVIRCDSSLEKYMTDYVPTTIFVDSEGNILTEEPIVGANSHSDWEELINEYL